MTLKSKGENIPPHPSISCGTRLEVLRAIVGGISSIKGVGRAIGKDKNTVKYHLRLLDKAGLLVFGDRKKPAEWAIYPTKEGRKIIIKLGTTRMGIAQVQGGVATKKFFVPVGYEVIRLHKVWYDLGICVLPKLPLGKRTCWENGASFVDYELGDGLVRVWSNDRVLVRCRAVWGKSVGECENELGTWLLGFRKMVEDWLKAKVGDVSSWVRLSGEYAFVNEKGARLVDAAGHKLRVLDECGELRLIVDRSFGVPELEAVHSKYHVVDARRVEEFYQFVISGEMEKLIRVFRRRLR